MSSIWAQIGPETTVTLSRYCGPKCSVVPITLEKELSTSHPLDISLDLTPGQRIRVEQCANCGEEMQPDHQCSISPEKIPVEVEKEVVNEMVQQDLTLEEYNEQPMIKFLRDQRNSR